MINVLWPFGARGFMDHGLLMDIFAGKVWPLPDAFLETMGMIAPNSEGAIVVCSGKMAGKNDDYLRAGIKALPWCLFIHTSDEELLFASEQFRHSAFRLWAQYGNPHGRLHADRWLPLGWPAGTREALALAPRLHASGRALWGFVGQGGHKYRDAMFSELRHRDPDESRLAFNPDRKYNGSFFVQTEGFSLGFNREDYLNILAHVNIAPCPSGNFSPDSFRIYEALEAGCIPIVNMSAPNKWPGEEWRKDYWDLLFENGYPFPNVEADWSGVRATLDLYGKVKSAQERMNKCLAWWIGQKRKLVHDMINTCNEIGASITENPLSIVISASPIPSHPSTEVIEQCIREIRKYPELKSAEVLIMLDGVRPEMEHRRNDYEEFKRRLIDKCNWDPEYFGCLPIVYNEWLHQAEMTRRTLKLVRTPLILFVEHDTFPLGEIPWEDIIDSFNLDLSPYNYLRLHIFDEIREEHKHLYDYEGSGYTTARNLRVRSTTQWSQRPHVARTDWYRYTLEERFSREDRTFIEDPLCSPAEAGEIPGMYIYAPEGNMCRSGTVDGRRDDPKAPVQVRQK